MDDDFKAHAFIVAGSATGGDSAGTCKVLQVVCQDLGRRRARQSVKAKRASRVPKERTVTRGGPQGCFKGLELRRVRRQLRWQGQGVRWQGLREPVLFGGGLAYRKSSADVPLGAGRGDFHEAQEGL